MYSYLVGLEALILTRARRMAASSQEAYKSGPPSARQGNAIEMALRWWVDSGPIMYAVREGSGETVCMHSLV